MALARHTVFKVECGNLTAAQIRAKLDTDLSTDERQQFLNGLLQTPRGTSLLTQVGQAWKVDLAEQQLAIRQLAFQKSGQLTMIEKLREAKSPLGMGRFIAGHNQQVSKLSAQIARTSATYAKSARHADETLKLAGPSVQAAMRALLKADAAAQAKP